MRITPRLRKIIFHGYHFWLSLVILTTVVNLLALALGGNFFFEYVVSFLPYAVALGIVALVFIALVAIPVKAVRGKLLLIAVCLLVVNVLIGGGQILNNYYAISNQNSKEGTKSNQKLRVAFYNKLFKNKNFEEMNRQIDDIQADVLVMSEVETADIEALTSLNSYAYNYQFTGKAYQDLHLVLYSKLELNAVQIEVPELPTVIVYLSLNDGRKLKVIGLHTAAPVTQALFIQRNRQLDNLISALNASKLQTADSPTILLGDHNLTPYSPTYRAYAGSFASLGLHNVSRSSGLQFSWSLDNLGLIRAHIDQLFVSDNIAIKQFIIGKQAGSDHHLIAADLEF